MYLKISPLCCCRLMRIKTNIRTFTSASGSWRSTLQSITTSMTVRYGSSAKSDKKAPQRVVETGQNIVSKQLASLGHLYTTFVKRAGQIHEDGTHPGHHLFTLLPFLKTSQTHTNGLKHNLFPRTVAPLNLTPQHLCTTLMCNSLLPNPTSYPLPT